MFKKITALFLICVLFSGISAQNALSIPKGSFVNPVTETAWMEIPPIKMGGLTLMAGSGYDTPDIASSLYCICPFPPPVFYRIGIPVSFWEPHKTVSTTKDPYFFPELGMEIGFSFGSGNFHGTSQSATEGTHPHTFYQSHWLFYPIWAIIGLLKDLGCVQGGGIDVFYMTEIDPLWNDDSLSLIIHPEVLLFQNPIAQLACVADAVSVNLWRPMEALFWCIGSGGSAYPLTGRSPDESMIQASLSIANKMTYKLSRELLLWDKALNWCTPVISPIWVKPHFKYQQQRPTVRMVAHPVGLSSWRYQTLANPSTGTGVGSSENFSWLFFQKSVCCFL